MLCLGSSQRELLCSLYAISLQIVSGIRFLPDFFPQAKRKSSLKLLSPLAQCSVGAGHTGLAQAYLAIPETRARSLGLSFWDLHAYLVACEVTVNRPRVWGVFNEKNFPSA